MEDFLSIVEVSVMWRGNKYVVQMNSDASVKAFGQEMQRLTDVKEDTMRFIVPLNKGSKLLSPFSDEHSSLSLQDASLTEGKTIRMMGVPEDEINNVRENEKADMRIVGFDEEERRMRNRTKMRPQTPLKLPQGQYIFCEFRTLQLPGIELNPPASEALKRMHMLAADPGIVGIMNKHHWRVGIMTEMAPVGYVGVSPKCILGFNKNHGEEISLRLRTDDLKGFRKYESIKKTLLHELAHMIYSEHDANFFALNKQLNEEAKALDWTRSKGQTLSGLQHSHNYEDYFVDGEISNLPQKLGGNINNQFSSARASSVTAAYHRLAIASANSSEASKVHEEPDPDDSESIMDGHVEYVDKENCNVRQLSKTQSGECEPDPDDHCGNPNNFEPDPDDSPDAKSSESELTGNLPIVDQVPPENDPETFLRLVVGGEPDNIRTEIVEDEDSRVRQREIICEPDQDSETGNEFIGFATAVKSDVQVPLNKIHDEPDPDESHVNGTMQQDSHADHKSVHLQGATRMDIDEPDPDDQELKRIQDSVSVVCNRLQEAIKMLQSELTPAETASVLQTLFKIIRNLIDHPGEMKFKKIRKANPIIQRNVAKYKAAMEILYLIGFIEDNISAEAYLVLKRNDPGLLWLAKSSLETSISAC